MELTAWHIVAGVGIFAVWSLVNKWLDGRKAVAEAQAAVKQAIAAHQDPVQAATGVSALDTYEQAMKTAEKAREKTLMAEPTDDRETFEFEGETYHQILTPADFR